MAAIPTRPSKTRPNETVISMKENKTKKTRVGGGISIRAVSGIVTFVAVLLAFYAFTLASRVDNAQTMVSADERRYLECSEAINDLQTTSDFLTSQARSYVATGRREYLDAYINEIEVTNRRGKALEVLRSTFSVEDKAAKALEQALAASDALAKTELVAMKLAAGHYGLQDLPEKVKNANVDEFQGEGGEKGTIDVAMSLVLDGNYDTAKHEIQSKVESSSNVLLIGLDAELTSNEALVQNLLFQLRVSVALLLCVIMVLVLALLMYVIKPLGNYVKRISNNEPLDSDGAYELHYLANAYNAVYEDNAKRIEQLRTFAERDPLTGISNRSGYDNFLATHTRDIVLLLIDIDNFADYNAVYGHDAGDAVLIRLAGALSEAFRSTDFPCRVESDTFAVVMTNMNTDLRNVIVNKIEYVNAILSNDAEDLPLVTLSVGAAFSTEGMSDKDIFYAADAALQDAKRSESNSIVFYGENNTVS